MMLIVLQLRKPITIGKFGKLGNRFVEDKLLIRIKELSEKSHLLLIQEEAFSKLNAYSFLLLLHSLKTQIDQRIYPWTLSTHAMICRAKNLEISGYSPPGHTGVSSDKLGVGSQGSGTEEAMRLLIDADLVLQFFLCSRAQTQRIDAALNHLLNSSAQLFITSLAIEKLHFYLGISDVHVAEDAIAFLEKNLCIQVIKIDTEELEYLINQTQSSSDTVVEAFAAARENVDAIISLHPERYFNTLPYAISTEKLIETRPSGELSKAFETMSERQGKLLANESVDFSASSIVEGVSYSPSQDDSPIECVRINRKLLLDADLVLQLFLHSRAHSERVDTALNYLRNSSTQLFVTSLAIEKLRFYLELIDLQTAEDAITFLEQVLHINLIEIGNSELGYLVHQVEESSDAAVEAFAANRKNVDAIISLDPEQYLDFQSFALSIEQLVKTNACDELDKAVYNTIFRKEGKALAEDVADPDTQIIKDFPCLPSQDDSSIGCVSKYRKLLLDADLVLQLFLHSQAHSKRIDAALDYLLNSTAQLFVTSLAIEKLHFYLGLSNPQTAEDAIIFLEQACHIEVIEIDKAELEFLINQTQHSNDAIIEAFAAVRKKIDAVISLHPEQYSQTKLPALSIDQLVGTKSCAELNCDFSEIYQKLEHIYQYEEALIPGGDYAGKNLQGRELVGKNLCRADLSRANLQNAFLNNVDLSGANLRDADLRGANLTGAILRRADLENAVLDYAILQSADLGGATLKLSSLRKANLTNAQMRGVNLTGADLTEAILVRVVLRGAKLQSAKLNKANLSNADLIRTNFIEAELKAAILRGAKLNNSVMKRANLDDADLRPDPENSNSITQLICVKLAGAKLRGAKLCHSHARRTNFTDSNLQGADLSYAKLLNTNFEGVNLDRANLSYADLGGAILTKASLIAADLTCVLLRGASLREADLSNACLEKVSLQGAYLHGVNLSNARLCNSQATRANFNEANLQNATLEHSELRNASFERANLNGANLKDAQLSGAILVSATLQKANLSCTVLQGASLKRVDLEGANLERAEVQGAYLKDSNLTGAILICADLSRSRLKRANLSNAKLNEAILRGADLRCANLAGAQLSKAVLEGANLTGANCKGTHLLQVNLGWANLSSTIFTNAVLNSSDLTGVDLSDADMRGAQLADTRLSKARLLATNLEKANLTRANLYRAYLNDATLIEADLTQATLDRADLSGANLQAAILNGASLNGGCLIGASLTQANLTRATFCRAYLRYTDFSFADLEAANFDLADLTGAILDPSFPVSQSYEFDLMAHERDRTDRLADAYDALERFWDAVKRLEEVHQGFSEKSVNCLSIIHDLANQIEWAQQHYFELKEQMHKISSPSHEPASLEFFRTFLHDIHTCILDSSQSKRFLIRVCLFPRNPRLWTYNNSHHLPNNMVPQTLTPFSNHMTGSINVANTSTSDEVSFSWEI